MVLMDEQVGAWATRRVWSLSLYSCYCGSRGAVGGGRRGGGAGGGRGGGGAAGGASAVEAGQSCSRHQGRHFLWRERDRREGKDREISDDTHPKKTFRFFFFSLSFLLHRQRSA